MSGDVTERARFLFEETCQSAGVEPSEERWERYRVKFVASVRHLQRKVASEKERLLARESASNFVTKLGELMRETGCRIDIRWKDEGVVVVTGNYRSIPVEVDLLGIRLID